MNDDQLWARASSGGNLACQHAADQPGVTGGHRGTLGPYEVLVVDPPWLKRKGGRRRVRPRQGRSLDYPTLPTGAIFDLLDQQVLPMAAPTHNVFLWAVDQFLAEAEDEMRRRDYRLHARIVWNKTNGVAPCFTLRYAHEYLLWFYKPRLMPVAPPARGRFTTVITERAREHSRKPDAAYEMIAALYPDAARTDVFSREKRAGWDQWGDEVDRFSSRTG